MFGLFAGRAIFRNNQTESDETEECDKFIVGKCDVSNEKSGNHGGN